VVGNCGPMPGRRNVPHAPDEQADLSVALISFRRDCAMTLSRRGDLA
jgi:hypothetical protein